MSRTSRTSSSSRTRIVVTRTLEILDARRTLLLLVAGASLGYAWGYHEGSEGLDHVGTRVLNKLGWERVRSDARERAARIRQMQEERERAIMGE